MNRMAWAKAQKKTAFGETAVSWMREDDSYQLQVFVPAGLTAKCYFPADCKCLKNAQTGELYTPDEKGYFSFSLGAGQWHLNSDETV
jgi:hypothetical protein